MNRQYRTTDRVKEAVFHRYILSLCAAHQFYHRGAAESQPQTGDDVITSRSSEGGAKIQNSMFVVILNRKFHF